MDVPLIAGLRHLDEVHLRSPSDRGRTVVGRGRPVSRFEDRSVSEVEELAWADIASIHWYKV